MTDEPAIDSDTRMLRIEVDRALEFRRRALEMTLTSACKTATMLHNFGPQVLVLVGAALIKGAKGARVCSSFINIKCPTPHPLPSLSVCTSQTTWAARVLSAQPG